MRVSSEGANTRSIVTLFTISCWGAFVKSNCEVFFTGAPPCPPRDAPISYAPASSWRPTVDLRDFQRLIEKMYSHKHLQRGSAGTFLWLVEEIGELATAIGEGTPKDKREE